MSSGVVPALPYLPEAKDCGDEDVEAEPSTWYSVLELPCDRGRSCPPPVSGLCHLDIGGLDLTFLMFPPTPTFGVQKVPSQASAPENTHAYTHAHTAEEN